MGCRVRLALAGTATVCYVAYRLRASERELAELCARLDAAETEARAQAIRADVASAARTGMLSTYGSFQTVVNEGSEAGALPVIVALSVAERLQAAAGQAGAHFTADALFDESRYAETVAHLGGLAEMAGGDDCERVWRLARDYYVPRIFRVSPRAISTIRTDRVSHKWAGIVISEASSLESTKAAIERSVDVRKHFEQAVLLNPADPTSRHLLGLWHYEIANIGWVAKKIAAAIWAEPPSSSFDSALELLLAAEELDPGFYIKNQLMLAKAHFKLGSKAEARKAAQAEAVALARTL
ncbi:hypothetical protein T492DRAFT_846336 [Pavlovales sp. CCMP2436]|nr:hypothetical protein T492DRAFT_846336 [Pavlovales sp. CCMP2436]